MRQKQFPGIEETHPFCPPTPSFYLVLKTVFSGVSAKELRYVVVFGDESIIPSVGGVSRHSPDNSRNLQILVPVEFFLVSFSR